MPQGEGAETQASGTRPDDLAVTQDSGPAPVPMGQSHPRMGRYEILEELGRGGMGVVYRALDTELRREVALKTLHGGPTDAERVARLLREARTVAGLDHPGIVPIHDMGEIGGIPYFAMTYVRGRTFAQALSAGEFPEVRDRLRLLQAAAEAVAFAHSRRVVHRDLKPGNLLVDAAGKVHVMDFGLALCLDEDLRMTATGQVLGTPLYMAPEQMEGDRPQIGPPADVYSLGAVLYECLTGAPPFTGAHMAEVLAKALATDPVPPRVRNPRVHADLETVALKALDRDPGRRYADAGELAAELDRFLKGEPILARPMTGTARLWRRVQRNRTAAACGAAALLLAMTFGGTLAAIHRRAALDLDEAVSAGRREREAGRPAPARDAWLRALQTTPGHVEAREGLAWADAELDREARKAAEAERRARQAETALEKARRVQSVLSRWAALRETIQRLEAVHYDSTLSAEARCARAEPLWQAVESFLRETPEDPSAQASARAFAGWARWLADVPDEGLAWMREATRLDPAVPYGALLEAMTDLSSYLRAQPWPRMTTGAAGLAMEPLPPESEPMRGVRERLTARLDEAARAEIWGEGMAAGLRPAIEAVQALQAERWEDADRLFGQAAAVATELGIRSELLFARGKARFLARKFAEGRADLEEVERARPNDATVQEYLGHLEWGAGLAGTVRGEDPRAAYLRAIERFTHALALDPARGRCRSHRANAHSLLAIATGQAGEDPTGPWGRAIEDYSEILRSAPGDARARANRANAQAQLGEAIRTRGEEALAWYERSLADYDEAVRGQPASARLLHQRGYVRMEWGRLAMECGRTPGDAYALALADFDEALRRGPDALDTRLNRGVLQRLTADIDAAAGRDPIPAYDRAIADLGAVIDARPEDYLSRMNRAEARVGRARAELRGGADPRGTYDLALADFAEAGRIAPASAQPDLQRGILYGEWALSAGQDPGARTALLAEADRAFSAAISKDPRAWMGWGNRGQVRQAQGRFAEAVADLEEAVRRGPNDPTLEAKLGAARAEVERRKR